MLSTVAYVLKHPLNRGDPAGALYRLLRWQVISRLGGDVETPWFDGAKIVARHGMNGVTGNLYCGLVDVADMALVLHLLRPGDVFLDIGANVGSYTILASKIAGARTFAFEPDPGTAEALRKNIMVNGIEGLVTLHRMALGDSDGVIDFTLGKDAMNRVATAEDVERQSVPLRRLDDLGLPAPTMIKMDVEGFESQVVRGGQATFSSPTLLAVLSECNTGDVREFLESQGFRLSGYDPHQRRLIDGEWLNGNALFVRKSEDIQARVSAASHRRVNRRTI